MRIRLVPVTVLLLFACAPDAPDARRPGDVALQVAAPDAGPVKRPAPDEQGLPRGFHRVLAIWVEHGTTDEEDVRAVLGEVTTWFRGVSGGRFHPGIDLAGPFTDVHPTGADDVAPLRAAWDAGFDLDAYDRFLVLETGGGDRDEAVAASYVVLQRPGDKVTVHAPRVLVGAVTNSMETVGRIVQQVGFSLGLSSADHLSTLDGLVRAGGNLSDVMGSSRFRGAFGAPAQELLGWVDADEVITADGPGDFVISALEMVMDTRALRLPVPAPEGEGGTWWLYAEVRRPVGPAAEAASLFDVPDGAVINLVRDPDGSAGLTTRTLDATPETPSLDSADAALLPGRTLAVPGTDWLLSVVASGDGASHLRLLQGRPDNSPPVIRKVTATPEGDGWRLQVKAEDPDGDALDAFWNLGVRRLPPENPDSQVEPSFYEPGTYADGLSVHHAFPDGRPRRVFVRVTDRCGGEALGFVDLLGHENRRPVIEGVDVTPLEDGRYRLDASAVDPDGDLLSYRWTAPFGQTSSLPAFTFVGDPATVRLVVDDGELAATRSP